MKIGMARVAISGGDAISTTRGPDWFALFEEGGDSFTEVVCRAQFGVDVETPC
jgi:hypothetical protein